MQYAIVTVDRDGRVPEGSTVTIGTRTTEIPAGTQPASERIAVAVRALGYKYDNSRSLVRKTGTCEFPVRPRDDVMYEAKFTGRRLEIRTSRWASNASRTPFASAGCRTLDRAPRVAAELGFELSRSWEDCGDGAQITECWPTR